MDVAKAPPSAGIQMRTALREGFYLTLFELTRDVSVYRPLLFLYWLFDLIQMLHVVIAPPPGLPWAAQPVVNQGIFKVLLVVGIIPGFGDAFPANTEFALCIVILLTILVLFSWSVVAHAGFIAYVPSWRARLLRELTFVSTQGLLIPLFATLASSYNCASFSWMPGSSTMVLPCWTGGHAAAVAAASLILPLSLVLLTLIALLAVDRAPSKKNVLAAPHGRVAAAMVLLKATLGIFTGVTGGIIDPWVWCIIMVCVALAWLWLYRTYLPYHVQMLNALQGAAAAAMLAAAACGLLSLGIANPSSSTGAIAWLMLLPTSLYTGASIITARFRSFAAPELVTPFAVELRSRFLLAESASSLAASDMGRMGVGGRAPYTDAVPLEGDAATSAAAAVGDGGGKDETTSGMLSAHGDAASATDKCLAADLHARVSNVRKSIANASASAAALTVDTLYDSARVSFPASPLLDLFAAFHQAHVKRNAHLARVFYRSAAAKLDASTLDVRFFIWVAAHEAAAETLMVDAAKSGGVARMTVQRRMHFEELLEEARNDVLVSRSHILTFWGELSDRHPDLLRVATAGRLINTSLKKGRRNFDALLELSPNSSSVMREFADFLFEQCNDPQRAEELLKDAEQIEDEQSRAHQQTLGQDVVFFASLSDFDLSAENLAWIRVSALDGSTGIVTGANAACLKLFGMQRRELVGKDVNTLVPDPIGPVHGRYLARFKADGVEHVVNHSRVAFALHRLGHLVPIRINTRPQEEDWVAVVEEIQTSLSFVWCLGPAQNWRVTAACPKGIAALGTSASAIKSGNVSMHTLFTDPSATFASLLDAPDGGVTDLRGSPVMAKAQLAGFSYLTSSIFTLRWRPILNSHRHVSAGVGGAAKGGGSEAGDVSDGGSVGSSADSRGGSDEEGEEEGDEVLNALVRPNKSADPKLKLLPDEKEGAASCPAMPASAGGKTEGSAAASLVPLKKKNPHLERRPSTIPLDVTITSLPASRNSGADGDPSRSSQNKSSRIDTGASEGSVLVDAMGVDDSSSENEQLRQQQQKQQQLIVRVNSKGSGKFRSGSKRSAAKSAHSRSSAGSHSSSIVAQQVRRGVAMRSAVLDGSLVTLIYTLRFITVLIIICCIAQLVVVQQLFGQLDANFILVSENADAAVALQDSYTNIQRLVFTSSGILSSNDDGKEFYTYLHDALHTLESKTLALYSKIDGLSPKQTALWTVPSIIVGDLQPGTYFSRGNYTVIERSASLANLGVEFVAKGRQVLALPLSAITMNDSFVHWTSQNGMTTIRDAYNASMIIASERSSTQGATILAANFTILGVTLGLLLIIAIFLILPAVNTVIASKNKIFNVFLTVPIAITKALHLRTRNKIEALSRASAEANVGLDIAGAGELPLDGGDGVAGGMGGGVLEDGEGGVVNDGLDEALAALRKELEDAGSTSVAAAVSLSNEEAPPDCCGRLRSARAPRKRGGGSSRVAPRASEGRSPSSRSSRAPSVSSAVASSRRFRSAAREQFSLLVRFLWPLSAYAAYFIGTYFWLSSTVTSVQFAKEEVLWSAQVRFGTTAMALNTLIFVGYRGADKGEVEFMKFALSRSLNRSITIDVANNDLLYGSATLGTRAGLQISPSIYSLFLTNGCVDNKDYYYKMADCESESGFMSGLVGQGLLPAFKTYIQLNNAAIISRYAQIGETPGLGTGGVTLPYMSLNEGIAHEILKLGEEYLHKGFDVASMYWLSSARTLMSSFLSSLILACCLCIVSLGLAYAIFMPTILLLDREIKMVRYLLLLFPDKVSATVPAILAAGRELVQGTAAGGGSASSKLG